MGFIDIKNFTAPFVNRTHLIAIVGVTICFAVFRLSGGSVSTQHQERRAVAPVAVDPQKDKAARELRSLLGSDVPATEERAIPKPVAREDETGDLLGGMLDESQKQRQQKAPEHPRPKGLEEIEKAMGLR
jgi:hypothetical protein